MRTNNAIAAIFVVGASLRCITAYRPIMGKALGSIIAAIMMAQPTTNATPS
jgi:hypothetical protein